MIIASAMKIRTKNCADDIVMCGCRHGDIFVQWAQLGLREDDILEETEGFITNKNEFLDRKEALKHARECGQLCWLIDHEIVNGKRPNELISEDLW